MALARRTRRPVPPEVRAVYDVWPASRPFLALFQDLDRRREWGVGMGGAIPQAIRVTETVALARVHGVDPKLALRMVGAMDDVYRAARAESEARSETRGGHAEPEPAADDDSPGV